jgi:hypothetical protein
MPLLTELIIWLRALLCICRSYGAYGNVWCLVMKIPLLKELVGDGTYGLDMLPLM